MNRVSRTEMDTELSGVPGRFRKESLLGRGGGGAVYAATDLTTGAPVAIKVLHEEASGSESEALIRETITLSGLEGLGFPRVLRLGRTCDGRPYLVREMVEGQGLDRVYETEPGRVPALICLVADALSVVHRAGMLHGDVKPANVIVRHDGGVSLVDLGLATALREGGGMTAGLTPYYAAPEVRRGEALSPQAEVFSLGVMLADALKAAYAQLSIEQGRAVGEVSRRATAQRPADRFPSTDEFSQALRLALGGDAPLATTSAPWPVLGVEAVAHGVRKAIEQLPPGGALVVTGPGGSGMSTLLRRVAWSASLEGSVVGYVDEATARSEWLTEESGRAMAPGGLLIVDCRAPLDPELVASVQASGARVIIAEQDGTSRREVKPPTAVFELPPLSEPVARQLLSTALPGLSEAVMPLLFEKTQRRPGALRAFSEAALGQPIAGAEDLEAIFEGTDLVSVDPLRGAEHSLARGHYAVAEAFLRRISSESPFVSWLWARFELAAGSGDAALQWSDKALQGFDQVGSEEVSRPQILTTRARALLGIGRYDDALRELEPAESFPVEVRSEARAYRGFCQTLIGEASTARHTLQTAVAEARTTGKPRLVALSLSCLATAEWRLGCTEEAVASYRAAIQSASEAADAGMLASCLINLAGLLKERGELAESMRALESAVDAATRSGRLASLHQALLNLSNADLYLGRLERARAALARVGSPEGLAPTLRAQMFGLRAELAVRSDDLEGALEDYQRCERAWAELGRPHDAAEAALEAVLAAAGPPDVATSHHQRAGAELERLRQNVARGREYLKRPSALLRLAEARIAFLEGDAVRAEQLVAESVTMATEAGQREWAWRAVALEGELARDAGRQTRAARARERAVEILEDIAARLPEDLRAVFWNEPRRASLRMDVTRHSVRPGAGHGRAERTPRGKVTPSGSDALSRLSQTPLERRLARILAINGDLAAEMDLPRLAEKIVAHAAELLDAERGFLLLGRRAEELRVCASRGGQGRDHEDFSRTIAGQVLEAGRPLVSVDAARDQRLKAFESVHLDLISAVACVPVLSPAGVPVGALYLETRAGARPDFGDELSTLQAFADQVAIALENARLVAELAEKTRALEQRNVQLEEARSRLRQLLGRRTARLREVRQELATTRGQLSGHSSYAGLVGTSDGMRRIYQLIDRIKDTDVPVLITGESGTGKEMVARAIYQGSVRSKGKMLAVNCGAIPQSILESELFGHVRGAFTGADRDRRGLFREADGGVLFLDEIGETPLKMQASLLRVLQEGMVRPVGGQEEVAVDVRVIFATNRDLDQEVLAGRFREDLLYRIRVVELELPALRKRRDDIPLLVDHFLGRFSARFGQAKKTVSRDALRLLLSHPLPGNVRQLENVLLNAWVLCESEQIEAEDIALPRASSRPQPSPGGQDQRAELQPGAPEVPKARPKGTLSEHQRDERARIVAALEQCAWNRAHAARIIGMPRRTFYRRLKEYGLQR